MSSLTLFLDFDGVLHPEFARRHELFCELPRFERVLRDASDVQIVVSSSWRMSHTLAELQALFSPDIAARIVGHTPPIAEDEPDQYVAFHREAECRAWMRAHCPSGKWLALDDRPDWFKPFNDNVVHVVGETGLTSADEVALRLRIQRAGCT
jgi:hypothetical protein